MADKQILVTGSSDAPEGYTVPNTVELIPKAVSAVFDGTGASGNFVPIVEIVSDGGVVVAQSPASQVSAGGQAEVSWFPRVGGSASSGINTLPYAVLRKNGSQTIGAGATVDLIWDDFRTTNDSVFSWLSAFPETLHVHETGLYQWWLSVAPDIGFDWPAAGTGNINFYGLVLPGGTGNVENLSSRDVFAQYPYVTEETGQTSNDGTFVTSLGLENVNTAGTANGVVVNNTAADWDIRPEAIIYFVRIGDAVVY